MRKQLGRGKMSKDTNIFSLNRYFNGLFFLYKFVFRLKKKGLVLMLYLQLNLLQSLSVSYNKIIDGNTEYKSEIM